MCKRLLFSTINTNTALAIVTNKAEGKVQFFHGDLFVGVMYLMYRDLVRNLMLWVLLNGN